MFPSLHRLTALRIANAALFRLILAVVMVAGVAGCKTSAHSSDPHLRKIDEMLDAELPKGTPMTKVNVFLSSNGYRVEDSGKPRTIVAIVRHIDTETLRPATARVTFHFNAGERLTTYDLAPAPDEPIQP
jgi:hypothetical protein